MCIGAAHHNFTCLDGLTQGLENGAWELGELIHKQHTIVGEAYFPWLGAASSAHNCGH